MEVLNKAGIGIAMKKGWLRVDGGCVVEDAIYLPPILDFSVKAKKPVIYTMEQDIKLGGRYLALVEYHPDLRTKGTLNGPSVLIGDELDKIAFRFMGDEDIDFTAYPWIIKLIIANIKH
jgi:hypothetical protein